MISTVFPLFTNHPFSHLALSLTLFRQLAPQFTQSRNVIRKDIQSTTKLPADDILEMLNGVASMRHGHGWNFRLERDVEFLNKYPDIVTRQNAFWDQKVKALVNQVWMSEIERVVKDVSSFGHIDGLTNWVTNLRFSCVYMSLTNPIVNDANYLKI